MAVARPRVGLIGLGGMGRGIAQNLLKNGYPAAVYDIRPEPVRDSAAQGAIPCASSAEVGAHSDIVMLIPFSYTDVRSILLEDGLLAALAPGSTIVVMATVGPAEAREVARLAAEQGVRTLDAPVSGGPHGAEQGTLAVMVGGPPEVLEACRGPLAAISKGVFHIGPNPGDGQTAKMVNQLLVAAHFPNEDPIGKQIGLAEGSTAPSWFPIVGIAPDVRQRNLAGPDPTVYVPSRANPQPFAMLLVRGAPGTESVIPIVREEVRALDPELPLYGIMSMDQLLSQSRWPNRVFGIMLAVFASIALVLSAVGLYAVVAHSVSQRVQEIGLRMAFGAEARQVSWLVTRTTALPFFTGLLLGLAAALGVGRLLQSMLVQTSPTDPTTLLAIVLLLLAVSSVACWLPARRATRLDPVSALRHE